MLSNSEYFEMSKSSYEIVHHENLFAREAFHTFHLFSYLVTVFPLKKHRFKSVSPEDFRCQVGAAALCGHCCGLHHALKYDHHLQLRVILQGLAIDLVEGGLVVNLVDNRHRRDQEDSVSACVETHVDVCIVQWKEFALLCNPRLRRIEGIKVKKQKQQHNR